MGHQTSSIIDRAVIYNVCPKCDARPGDMCNDSHGRNIIHGERLHSAPPGEDPVPIQNRPYKPKY